MEEVPLLKDLSTRYSKDAVIVGIATDTSVEKVDRVVKEKGMKYPILADGKGFDGAIPKAYHVQGTPDLWVIDRQGRIFKYLTTAKTLEATLKDALSAAPDLRPRP